MSAKPQMLAALTLAERLERGWVLCNAAISAERERLDAHWIALLHEYEDVMNTPLATLEKAAA